MLSLKKKKKKIGGGGGGGAFGPKFGNIQPVSVMYTDFRIYVSVVIAE